MFFLIIVGFFQTPPAIFVTFTFLLKVFLGCFLIYRFNSYRSKVSFTELDRKIAFSAGSFILLISFTDYVSMFTDELKLIVRSLLLWIQKLLHNKIEPTLLPGAVFI
jgi:hypothetical protein